LDYQELIAGPDVFICDECVDVCNDVLAERRSSSSPESRPRSDEAITWPNPIRCALCQTAIRKDDGVVIAGNRGTLCVDCVNAVAMRQPPGRE
jgi:ATP-dependent protease Clp ATPase subunit